MSRGVDNVASVVESGMLGAETVEWVQEGGLLRALFAPEPLAQDMQMLTRFKRWNSPVENFQYQDYLDLLTRFVSLNLGVAEVKTLTANMARAIDSNPKLSESQREFLKKWLPTKAVGEMSAHLSEPFISIDDKADNGIESAELRLSERDLRNITPRILKGKNDIQSPEPFIALNFAFLGNNAFGVLFVPMSQHPIPELRDALILKLTTEFAANRYSRTELINVNTLFLMLECWKEADASMLKVVQTSENWFEYFALNLMYYVYMFMTKPLVCVGKWLYIRFAIWGLIPIN